PPSYLCHRSHSLTSVHLPPPSLKRASKPPSISRSSVPPSCSYCFSFESTVAQLGYIHRLLYSHRHRTTTARLPRSPCFFRRRL
ncbi:hypothetical protein S245_001562, partial [Arachis hypogaea]